MGKFKDMLIGLVNDGGIMYTVDLGWNTKTFLDKDEALEFANSSVLFASRKQIFWERPSDGAHGEMKLDGKYSLCSKCIIKNGV
jgi:hypothetical protein